jgi:hypothetical protein
LTAAAGTGDGRSALSAAVVLAVPAMPIDFNRDGISDVVTFSSKRKSGTVTVISAGTSREYKVSAPSIVPALGDYDGDGATDIAVLSRGKRNFEWLFINRETGLVTREQFGPITSTILVGCNFDTSIGSEMASFARNTLTVKRQGRGPQSRVKLNKIYSDKTLRGCGDVDGDGIAELIFNTARTSSAGRKRVTLLDLDVVKLNGSLYKTIPRVGKFHRAFVADVAGDGTNDIAIQRSSSTPIFTIYEGDTDQVSGSFSVQVASSYSFGVSRDSGSNTFHPAVSYGKSRGVVTTRAIKTGAVETSSISISGRLANSYHLHRVE